MSQNLDSKEAEQQRVNHIRSHVGKEIDALTKHDQKTKSEIIQLRKTFWEDVTVNMDNPEDAAESISSIKQQSELLGERERTHGQMDKTIHTLERLKGSPYFGRIDFREEGQDEVQSIYLGISSLLDEEQKDFLIHDWRAPISSLYYDFAPGEAYYTSPEGTTEGEMTKKRQFIIQSGQIKSMFDTGLTIGDDLLKEVLGNEANSQMKSIVATIQSEQNQLIRDESSRYLVVQGAAGSGKTSAALQRAAYLLYRHIDTLSAKNMMLFSPNPLFNSYVAKVLPELGEDNMEQTTFLQYISKRLGTTYEIEDAFMQTEKLLTLAEGPQYESEVSGIRYKSSLAFKKMIDDYLERLSNEGLLFKQVRFRGEILIEASRISAYFYSLDRTIPLNNRMKLTAEWLLIKLTRLEKLERSNGWVEDEIELLGVDAYQEVQKEYQVERGLEEDTFDEAKYERQKLAEKLVAKQFKPLKNAVKKMNFIHVDRLFKNVFKQSHSSVPTDWNEICERTLEQLDEKKMLFEDVTPYLYLKDRLGGVKANHVIQHVFIDEAQDYSPFQFEYLKLIYPAANMTILGDVNQAVYAQSQHQMTMLDESLHTDKQHQVMTLNKSYRSTKQIVDLTKQIITDGDRIEAFNRKGDQPLVVSVDHEQELDQQIIQEALRLKEVGHLSIAIITKTAIESEELYDRIKDQVPVKLLTKNSHEFERGLHIVPSYLSKGIEFDAVIVHDASTHVYKQEHERTLFYTVCTRAMHELVIFSLGKMTTFLDEVSQDVYRLVRN
ncbi:RNA polymerase recycling motor HelD [Alkalicoccobacillus murimartini]|uniref:DNA helicase-2/ATP-dependent DNA helicase PcrA n=1 Tax=Alkalicoccobacillus murimartini TaxID=171685 RepID=A0ABT9YM83_9BACI|nr:RNA polymerase recycling motor HelD [Alkalicoccobacillus murimartini]MDQ0208987.1 DNA helicase-2/ATP-dependent DNA helicase PcrA [Alkalicoccobacillus murimartini]